MSDGPKEVIKCNHGGPACTHRCYGQSRGHCIPVGAPDRAESLLMEALEHVTPKPWDDRTLLHARICEYLGLPVPFHDIVSRMRRENNNG